jgi:hypothetical protein
MLPAEATVRAEDGAMGSHGTKAVCLVWRVWILALWAIPASSGDVVPAFEESQLRALAAGETLVLARRPDEPADRIDSRFVTTARYLKGSRARIWETIHDKENAAAFIDGVLESKVIEREGNHILVEQRTRVGGPKGDYRYRLKHELKPMERAVFTYAGGELKDVEGAWWIFDGPGPETFLVVYSLRIDAGFFAPQPIVRSGMKQSMPKTMEAIAREVARRGSTP